MNTGKFTTITLHDGRQVNVRNLTGWDVFRAHWNAPADTSGLAIAWTLVFASCTWKQTGKYLDEESLNSISASDASELIDVVGLQLTKVTP